MLLRWGLRRPQFPILLRLQAGDGESEYHFLTGDVGKGDTQVLLKAEVSKISEPKYKRTLAATAVDDDAVLAISCSQVVLQRLFRRAKAL